MQKRIVTNSEFVACVANTARPLADAPQTAWRLLMPQTGKSRRDIHATLYVRGYRQRLLKDC
jgi:hypothetical protein